MLHSSLLLIWGGLTRFIHVTFTKIREFSLVHAHAHRWIGYWWSRGKLLLWSDWKYWTTSAIGANTHTNQNPFVRLFLNKVCIPYVGPKLNWIRFFLNRISLWNMLCATNKSVQFENIFTIDLKMLFLENKNSSDPTPQLRTARKFTAKLI